MVTSSRGDPFEESIKPLKLLLPVVVFYAGMSGCDASPNGSGDPLVDRQLHLMVEQEGLPMIDVSVPFERLKQAPAQLEAVYKALQAGPSGVYVMRYWDDTLRQTRHVFVIDDLKRVYVKLAMAPHADLVQVRYDILAARYDVSTGSLILETRAGPVRLTPQDVTPVGA